MFAWLARPFATRQPPPAHSRLRQPAASVRPRTVPRRVHGRQVAIVRAAARPAAALEDGQLLLLPGQKGAPTPKPLQPAPAPEAPVLQLWGRWQQCARACRMIDMHTDRPGGAAVAGRRAPRAARWPPGAANAMRRAPRACTSCRTPGASPILAAHHRFQQIIRQALHAGSGPGAALAVWSARPARGEAAAADVLRVPAWFVHAPALLLVALGGVAV
jgi:hypothetical protein